MSYRIDAYKYTFINDNGVVDILRNGEIWSSGNKATLALLQKVERYERSLGEISTFGSLDSSAKHLQETAEKALRD